MPTSNAEELRLFLKCTVIGRGVFGPCACCKLMFSICLSKNLRYIAFANTRKALYQLIFRYCCLIFWPHQIII